MIGAVASEVWSTVPFLKRNLELDIALRSADPVAPNHSRLYFENENRLVGGKNC